MKNYSGRVYADNLEVTPENLFEIIKDVLPFWWEDVPNVGECVWGELSVVWSESSKTISVKGQRRCNKDGEFHHARTRDTVIEFRVEPHTSNISRVEICFSNYQEEMACGFRGYILERLGKSATQQPSGDNTAKIRLLCTSEYDNTPRGLHFTPGEITDVDSHLAEWLMKDAPGSFTETFGTPGVARAADYSMDEGKPTKDTLVATSNGGKSITKDGEQSILNDYDILDRLVKQIQENGLGRKPESANEMAAAWLAWNRMPKRDKPRLDTWLGEKFGMDKYGSLNLNSQTFHGYKRKVPDDRLTTLKASQ